jgi:hypothetical protein
MFEDAAIKESLSNAAAESRRLKGRSLIAPWVHRFPEYAVTRLASRRA